MMTVRAIPLFAVVALSVMAWGQRQPIEFPHNKHMEQGLECIDCHIYVDSQAKAGIPSARKCMLCHEKVATDGPGVQRLKEFVAKKQEPPWVRVYRFEHAASVKFQHSSHVQAGIECRTCHGNVSEMTVVTRQVEHTMGTCLSCHRENQASEDCVSCHF